MLENLDMMTSRERKWEVLKGAARESRNTKPFGSLETLPQCKNFKFVKAE